MDPEATLSEFHQAMRAGDVETAREHWDNLHDWISRGGFTPKTGPIPPRP
jgi:hypothetical protein